MNKKFGVLSSSTNPQELSATVSGGILAMSGLILVVANLMGLPLMESQVVEFAKDAGVSVGFLWMCFGLVRKGVVYLHSRFS